MRAAIDAAGSWSPPQLPSGRARVWLATAALLDGRGNWSTESIMNTISDLNRSGLVDDITMRNIEQLCLPDVQEYSPEQIVSIRRKFKLSQAAFASIFNISPSTVRKWEQGQKKPAGASRKLLDLMERKGVEVLL